MSDPVRISSAFIVAAMQSEGVRQKLIERANRIKAKAQAIASTEGVEGTFEVRTGVRPKGRPFASVHCDNVDQEFGTSKTARSRILGRAAH